MPEDYYTDRPDPSDQGNLPPEDAEKPSTDSETALIPKALAGDVSVGQTLTFKVVHIYEDEVEIEPSKNETSESEGGEPQYSQELRSLAEEE